MNSVNKLSVVIPIGKMAGKLHNLESTLNSINSGEIEWLLVHDHFDSETCLEIDSLILQCKPHGDIIRLETNKRGAGNARNTGLRAASGNWICFVDSDDFADISKYWEMLLLTDELGMLFGIGEYIHEDNKSGTHIKIHGTQNSVTEKLNEIARNPGLWRWIARRDRIGETEFYNVPMGEDLLFIKALNPDFREIFFYHEVIYTYKVGDLGQATKDHASLKSIGKSLEIALKDDRHNTDIRHLSKKITMRMGISTLRRNPLSLLNLKLILITTACIKNYLIK